MLQLRERIPPARKAPLSNSRKLHSIGGINLVLRLRVGLVILGLRRGQGLGRGGVEDVGGVDERGVGGNLEAEAGLVEVGDVEVAVDGDGLVAKEAAEDGQHALAVGRVGEVLLEGRVRLGDDEVVRVGPAGVRHDGDVVGGGHAGDLEQLRHAADPHDVGLQDVEVAALDQLAEAVPAVLVLARGELDGGMGVFEQRVAVEVVGRKALLPPVDAEVLGLLDQLDGVGHVERHVAVDHEGVVRADGLAVLGQEVDVLAHALGPFARAVGQRHLGAPEAHGLGRRRLGPGAVEVEAVPRRAANQLVHGLVADLAEQVPDGQVDDGYHGHGQAFAAVEHGAAVHLLEEVVRVPGVYM